jgi:hypothetical protein
LCRLRDTGAVRDRLRKDSKTYEKLINEIGLAPK